MTRVRCAICRQRLPTLKKLKSHYTSSHSKIQIINELLKNSIINSKATQNLLTKSKKRRKQSKYKTIYLHENVQLTYSDEDTVLIEEENSDENVIELSFADRQSHTPLGDSTNKIQTTGKENKSILIVGPAETKRRSKKGKKPKNLFHIGIRKIATPPKSLDERSGDFYECHCMEKNLQKVSSDTESGSDNGKIFYCSFCGSGYHSEAELAGHERSHLILCKICSQVLNMQNCREHFEQHLLRIYVCHLCGFEVISKEGLKVHLDYHFEQHALENILNMERDYNMYAFCNTNISSGGHQSNVSNILSFLTSPYDSRYTRSMPLNVVCDICHQEFHIFDFENHLRGAHLFHC